jgi:pimeloyl-ACP methyl ester carboxylesterase
MRYSSVMSGSSLGKIDEAAGPRTVSVGESREVAYATYGSRTGAPLVVFHGTPGSRLFGRLFDEAAHERDVRVVAIDRPGYGQSTPWTAFDPADVGEIVTPVLADLELTDAGLVAFSGGSPYALTLAAERPDVVRSVDIVAGATPPSLATTTPRPMAVLAWLARHTPGVLDRLLRAQCWLARHGSSSVVLSQYTDPETVPALDAERVTADFQEGLTRDRVGAIAEFRRIGAEWPVPLAEIDVTVRLWHGTDDTNVPIDGAHRLAAHLPKGSLTVLEDADHLQTLLRSRSDIVKQHRGTADDQRSSSSSLTS